ncbi:hypothetical protein BDA99DRAFT_491687 [Phascolomyces articulosus]|uniref:Uncharacterized protein n=1 Tax=Phascolomyces articulosus TaxID=60185 RepID=A0AAD5KQS5_9FUNG|nr:hypothetical protein BDA99DRAFT_491687 [Phascolomyces articulosus]
MNDRAMWDPSIRNEASIWENCVKTILGLLEDSFDIQNKGITSHKRLGLQKHYHGKSTHILRSGFQSQQQQQQQLTRSVNNNSNGSYMITKRKRSNFSDNVRDRKMQRISSSLANDIARHLSMTDHENNRPPLATPSSFGTPDDVDMDTNNNNNNNNSINKPIPPRIYKRPIRKSTTILGQLHQPPQLQQLPPASNTKMAMDFDQWLKQQAQRQNLNILDYRQAFHEKQNQLHHYLTHMDATDYTKTNDQRFQLIKENLEHILKIVNELSGDHSIAFEDIYPEWRMFEGHINKVSSYVQSIEDMKELISQAIPRTSDLLSDIQSLQSILESKVALYGDNLIQNGLGWKTMGMPVDEHLIATVKGWFYNLCIGLISELDTECSKLQSLVTDMRELLHHPEGDKLMESIQNGVEFIASVISFIGLPSRKLIYGCRILTTIYGQWASENLEFLRETLQQQQQQVNKHGSSSSSLSSLKTMVDVKMINTATATSSTSSSTTTNTNISATSTPPNTPASTTSSTTTPPHFTSATNTNTAAQTNTTNTNTNNHTTTRPLTCASSMGTITTARVDIRLMQWMDGVVQILTSLQTLQEVSASSTFLLPDGVSQDLEQEEETRFIPFDTESLNVLENLASTLVEITVRALSVIETSRSHHITHPITRQGNIMMNPETSLIYMQRSVLTFVDRLVELAGREHMDDSHIQRLHRHLEQNEEDLQL